MNPPSILIEASYRNISLNRNELSSFQPPTMGNDRPMPWQSFPYKIDAKAGQTVYFCSCGQTKNPPYCDGSHKGSGKTPHAVKVEKDGPVWACGCDKSKNLPFCDGSHKG